MKKYIKNKFQSFVQSSHWYNEVAFKDCRKFWELQDFELDVVNLGSTSGTLDFCYEGLNIKGYNWAVAPQTIVGDFAILKQYSSHLKEGATVLYPICPFTSISGAVDYVEDRCYSFLKFENIPEAHYLRMVKINQMKQNPISYYPLLSLKEDLKRFFFNKKISQVLSEEKLKIDADITMLSWNTQFQIADLSLPFSDRYKNVYDRGVALIGELSSYCKLNNYRLVIVVPPVYKTLANKFPDPVRKNLIDSFIDAANDDSFEYYNMMEDDRFSNDSSLFRSSYYLNEKGAKMYTKYLLNKLNIV